MALFSPGGLENFETAMALHRQVELIRQKNGDGPALASALVRFGTWLVSQQNLDRARPYFEEALAIQRRLHGNGPEIVQPLLHLGGIASELDRLAAAEVYWTEAAAILRKTKGNEHPDLAMVASLLGNVLIRQKKFDLARPHYEEALAIQRRQYGNESEIIQSLFQLGGIASELDQLATAETCWTEAAAILRKTKGNEHPDLAMVASLLGNVLIRQKKFDLARPLYEEALAIQRRQYGGRLEIVPLLMRLGEIAQELDKLATAKAYWTEAVTILRQTSESGFLAASLRRLGSILTEQNEVDLARQHFEEALAIRRRLFKPDSSEIAESLADLGRISGIENDFVAAQTYFTQVAEIHQKTLGGEHPDLARALHELGIVLHNQDKFTEGHRVTQAALNIFRSAYGDDHIDVANALHTLGLTLRLLDRRVEAKQCLQETLAIKRRIASADEASVAESLYYLGIVLSETNDVAGAKSCLDEALTVRRRILGDHHIDVARTKAKLIFILIALGNYEEAVQYASEAAQIQRGVSSNGERESIEIWNLLGAASQFLNNFTEAIRNHEEALAIARRVGHEWNIVRSLHYLGAALSAKGEFSTARECAREAFSIGRRIGGDNGPALGQLWLGLGHSAAAAGDDRFALECFSEALRIEMLFPDHLKEASNALSILHARRGALATAIFFGKQEVNAVQQMRGTLGTLEVGLQVSFLTSKEHIYHHLAAVLVDAGRLGEAQQVMSLRKKREFSEMLRQPFTGIASLTPRETEWKSRGDKLAEELAPLAAEEARTRGSAEHQAVSDKLKEVNQRFRAWFDQSIDALESSSREQAVEVETLNREALTELQLDLRALGPDVALLQYVLSPERLSIIVTTSTAQLGHEIAVTEQTINRLVYELRSAIERCADLKEVLPPAQELYRHLIAPAASTLEQSGARTLMVSLDGVIRYLPLAALHDGRYWLIERYALAMLTPAAPRQLDEPSSSDWRIAGFGVSRGRGRNGDLEGAADELNGIVRVDGAGRGIYPGDIYLNDAFTEDALAGASHDHQVIHIASHFVFKPACELASYLVTGDGRITLERFKQRPFDFTGVDLIALSACETAMGGGRESGREVEGLGALVQKQGARAVIATLWPARDWTTEFLMRRFYQERRERKRAKAAALRIAQLALLHDNYGIKTPPGETRGFLSEKPDENARYSHPYYWAPFILMGNWL